MAKDEETTTITGAAKRAVQRHLLNLRAAGKPRKSIAKLLDEAVDSYLSTVDPKALEAPIGRPRKTNKPAK